MYTNSGMTAKTGFGGPFEADKNPSRYLNIACMAGSNDVDVYIFRNVNFVYDR